MIFQTESQLKELGDKLSADKKAPIEAALQKLKDARKSEDLSAIDLKQMAEINTAFKQLVPKCMLRAVLSKVPVHSSKLVQT